MTKAACSGVRVTEGASELEGLAILAFVDHSDRFALQL